MKKVLLILTVLLGWSAAQADDYLPMVREGVKWVYYLGYNVRDASGIRVAFISYEFRDDVELNGQTYKKCWRTVSDAYGLLDTTPTVIAYVREQDKKVYAIYDESFIAQNRDYHAGYYDYGISKLVPGGALTVQGLEVFEQGNNGIANTIFYPEYTDEYLVYDFNDLPSFYAHYPHKVYHCPPIPNLAAQFDSVPNMVITESRYANVVGSARLGDGRNVRVYQVGINYKTEFDKNTLSAPHAPATEPSVYEGDKFLAVDGYGLLTLEMVGTLQRRSVAACINRSFISPEALLRHINHSLIDNDIYNIGFGFCHIEDGGKKTISYKYCDYYHKKDPSSDGGTSSIDDIDAEPVTIDGAYYDMQGRRIMTEPAASGIYIKGGKKVVIK